MNAADVSFGLVGYGMFGAHHAAAIASTPGARLTAIAVRSPERQQQAREAHPGVEVYADFRQMLVRDDLEIVSVAAPNTLHYEIGAEVLQAGKHLFLEKPMALSLTHCDELLDLAQEHDRILAINHELRLSSLWRGVRDLIADGAIGEPLHVLINLTRFPYRSGTDGWRYDRERVGSWILEEPIHFFDLARWWMAPAGQPESIYARANARLADHPELHDNFSAIVNYPGGPYAVVSQTLSAFEHHVSAVVTGTDGAISAHWSAADARSEKPLFGLRYGLGDDITTVSFDKPTGELLELADQMAAMVACVRQGAPPPCSGNDGRWSTLLCLAAEHSVETNAVVSIDDFVKRFGGGLKM